MSAATASPAGSALSGLLARPTISERLASFVHSQRAAGVPPGVLHEAKRLLVNQLKASVGATTHPAIQALQAWATDAGTPATGATTLWFGRTASPEHAIVVNGALFEVLDFNDTYIPCFMHAVSGVLPAALAVAQTRARSGLALLEALALGIEAELALACILMPSGYTQRGFIPGGLTGAIGAAAACALLSGLDEAATAHAIGLAMCSSFGLYESVGSDGLPYIMGMTARSGYNAAQLAGLGLTGPRTAVEGERGMLAAQSNEPASKVDAVLATLGESWRLFGNTYKTVPTETITHAPIECVMAVLPRVAGRTLDRLRFGVSPIVVKIADERRARFGLPSSELTARFDTRFCVAAGWLRGRFTLDEMREAAYTDPAILALRDRVELVADESFATFEGCWMEAFFTDGSRERADVAAFVGTPANPMTDEQLAGALRLAAQGLMPPARIDALLRAAWSLDAAPGLDALLDAACLG